MHLDKEVVNFLIYLIRAIKEENKSPKELDDYSIKGSAKYILRQIIRQMKIPAERMYVSQKALSLWNEKTNDDIRDKCYTDSVICKCDWLNRPQYIGASTTPKRVDTHKGQSFKFNEVFHDEHIVPVEIIIRELIKLDIESFNIENEIELILSNLSVCKILKEENVRLNKFNRPLIVEEVLEKEYKEKGILVYKYNEIGLNN